MVVVAGAGVVGLDVVAPRALGQRGRLARPAQRQHRLQQQHPARIKGRLLGLLLRQRQLTGGADRRRASTPGYPEAGFDPDQGLGSGGWAKTGGPRTCSPCRRMPSTSATPEALVPPCSWSMALLGARRLKVGCVPGGPHCWSTASAEGAEDSGPPNQ